MGNFGAVNILFSPDGEDKGDLEDLILLGEECLKPPEEDIATT
jgi:hypothetical protein